jgi:hypothetical protein
MLKKFILVTIILMIAFYCGAQEKNSKQTKIDTVYIKDLSDKLSIRIFGVNKFTRFDIKDNEIDSLVSYSPNRNLNLGFGLNYKWFGLGVAFNFPFINNDDDIYGKTKRFDAHTNIFTRNLAIDFYLSFYRGFYIENPESYLPDWTPGMPYPQRPDISTTKIGGSCIYAFKYRKYSTKAAFIQTDLQKKSAGSFLLGGFFSIFGIAGDSSFIPYELKEIYDPDLLFKKLSVFGAGVSFGYTHTFVLWKKLYVSFTLVPGISVQGYEIDYEEKPQQKTGSFLAGRLQARAALVYNTEKSYAGITAINDSYSGNTGKEQRSSLNYEVGVIRFFYGRRFNFPTFKKKKE